MKKSKISSKIFVEKFAFYGLDTKRAGTGTVTCQKSEPEPGPLLFRSRNRNREKIVTVSQHCNGQDGLHLGNWTNGSVCYLQPYLDGEWIHEAEEPGGFPTGDLEEDGDAQVHEGLHGQRSRHFVFDFSLFILSEFQNFVSPVKCNKIK
jgi:hypothetical protein